MAALGDKDVRWFDVAVYDAFGVSGFERLCDFNSPVQYLLERLRPASNSVLQCCTVQILHDYEGLPVHLVNLVDGANVGVVERRGGFGFALKAGERLRSLATSSGRNLRATERLSLTSSAL